MKRNILIFDYMDSLKDLFEHFLHTSLSSSFNIFYSRSVISQNDNYFIKSKKIFNKIIDFGFYNIPILFFSKRKNIVLTAGASNVYRIISNNVVLFDHGWGNKKTPGFIELKDPVKLKKYRDILKNTDYVICINDHDCDKYFNDELLNDIKKPVFIPLGMPRNDWLIKNKDNTSLKINTACTLGIKDIENKNVVLYAPTYRDVKEDNLLMMERLLLEFESIENRLNQNNIVILFRPHYFDSIFYKKLKKYKSIFYAGKEMFDSPRELMILSDFLITDYSSIYVDYLLLEKPVIFYAFDLEKYISYRGLVADYCNPIETPGPKISNLSEIIEVINRKKYFKKKEIIESKNYYFKFPDSKTCERVKNFIINL